MDRKRKSVMVQKIWLKKRKKMLPGGKGLTLSGQRHSSTDLEFL